MSRREGQKHTTHNTSVGHCLRTLRDPWPQAVCRLLESGESAVVRVLVAEVRGSAPREPGTCMLVTFADIHGSIGGGHLEWQAVRMAQDLLAAVSGSSSGSTEKLVQFPRLVLGRQLGQCCGGVVRLWIERFGREDLPLLRQLAVGELGAAILTEVTARGVVRQLTCASLSRNGAEFGNRPRFISTSESQATLFEPLEKPRPPLWLYGAGHVGQALVHILGELPFEVTWMDSRAELFPESLPDNVRAVSSPAPINTVGSAPESGLFLVMTHDHGLDYALCRRILERGQFAWLGLIGSKSKGARFRSRLLRDGVPPEQIVRLTCPIGVDGVDSKLPAAIAVAVAAQLLGGVGRAKAGAETVAAAEELAVAPPSQDARPALALDVGPAPTQGTGLDARDAGRIAAQDAWPPLAAEICTSPDCSACTARGGADGEWRFP